MSHRVLLGRVHLDVPGPVRADERAFWATALCATTRPGEGHPEYDVFDAPAATVPVCVQEVEEGPRIHLDIESDDVEAEVVRLVAAGARELRRVDDWVVLADPAGMPLCVVPVESANFDRDAVEVS